MATQFNLLPWREELRTKITKRNKAALITAVFIGLLASGVFYGYETTRLNDHNNALASVTTENNSLEPKLKQKKRLDDLKLKLNNQIDAIEALQADRASVSHMVEELSIANNQELFLTEFNLANGEVSIAGVAQNDTQIADLMKNLRKSEWYQEPTLIEIVSRPNLGEEVKAFKINSKLLLPGSEAEKRKKR